ncbi:9948_t:CDS:2, partial [Acaulospora colombiana]
LSFAILSLYIPASEIPSDALKEIIQKSYSTFRDSSVTPLHKINDQVHILELFHGPTFAFKDVALQFLGNLFEFFLLRRNAAAKKDSNLQEERITVLGATSGDTGSAAIYGLRSKANLSIVILHPYGRVSPIQEAQMTTVTDANVHNLAVHGTFDDCQDIVKTCFGDKEFNSKWKLGAINSINWARILAQMETLAMYWRATLPNVWDSLCSNWPLLPMPMIFLPGSGIVDDMKKALCWRHVVLQWTLSYPATLSDSY